MARRAFRHALMLLAALVCIAVSNYYQSGVCDGLPPIYGTDC